MKQLFIMVINGDTRKETIDMQLTDIKQVYPEFKAFKDVYTRLKIADSVRLSSSEGCINLDFAKESPFYRLYGKWEVDTELSKWIISGASCEILLQDANLIAKCLKKNAKTVESDDNAFTFKFIFKFLNEEENERSVVLQNSGDCNVFKSPFLSIEYNEVVMSPQIFEDDLIRLYQDGNTLTTERTDILILEVPRTSILSFQPKATEVTVRFTKNPEFDRKYVEVESTYEGLTLTQLFATI